MSSTVNLNNGMQAVPAQQIIDTGRIEVFTDNRAYANQTFNVQGQDAFATAVRNVGQEAAQAIAVDAQQPGSLMHALFQKDEWTADDRAIYEERLANEVSTRMDNVPGLHEYRIAQSDADYLNDLGIQYNGDIAGQRAGNLNDLGADVNAYSQRALAEGGTARMNTEGQQVNSYAVEYDCEAMAVAEGVALQIAENTLEEKGLFDVNDAGTNNFKQGMDYTVVSGGVMFGDTKPSGHQFIMTPLGSIVEATNDPSNSGLYGTDVYFRTNGNLQSFAQGQPLVAVGFEHNNRHVYGRRADDAVDTARFEQTYDQAAHTVIGDKVLTGGREAPTEKPELQEEPAVLDAPANEEVTLGDDVTIEGKITDGAPIHNAPDQPVSDNPSADEIVQHLLGAQGDHVDPVEPTIPKQEAAYSPPMNAPEYSLQDLSDIPAIRGGGAQVLSFDPATLETQTMLTQLGYELEGANNGRDGLEGPSTRENIAQYIEDNNLAPDISTAELQDHMVGQIVEQQNALAEVLENPGGEGKPVDTSVVESPATTMDAFQTAASPDQPASPAPQEPAPQQPTYNAPVMA